MKLRENPKKMPEFKGKASEVGDPWPRDLVKNGDAVRLLS